MSGLSGAELWLIGLLCGVLVALVGFIGRTVMRRLDRIDATVHREMRDFDRRVTRVETRLGIHADHHPFQNEADLEPR